ERSRRGGRDALARAALRSLVRGAPRRGLRARRARERAGGRRADRRARGAGAADRRRRGLRAAPAVGAGPRPPSAAVARVGAHARGAALTRPARLSKRARQGYHPALFSGSARAREVATSMRKFTGPDFYVLDELLTEDERMIRDTVRTW